MLQIDNFGISTEWGQETIDFRRPIQGAVSELIEFNVLERKLGRLEWKWTSEFSFCIGGLSK